MNRKQLGKYSKAKGARYERDLANKFKVVGFKDARRSVQYNGKQVEGQADIVGVPGLHIESKAVERLNIDQAYFQAYKDADAKVIPIVAYKKQKKSWKVVLDLDDFLKIYSIYKKDFIK